MLCQHMEVMLLSLHVFAHVNVLGARKEKKGSFVILIVTLLIHKGQESRTIRAMQCVPIPCTAHTKLCTARF